MKKLTRIILSIALLQLFGATAQAQIDSTTPHEALPEQEASPLAAFPPAIAPQVYLRGSCSLWGAHGENTNAMTTAFGGAWSTALYNEGTGVFNPDVCFIYMEGGDDCANEMNAYLNSNRAAIENWVANGGSLFINAAPNQGGDIDYGFGGVTLHSFTGSGNLIGQVTASNPGHPVFAGPNPTQTSFTGNWYSHGYVTGPGIASILVSNDARAQIAFSEKSSGSGNVMFGSMTTTNWHSPNPQARNLRANMFVHGATQCDLSVFEKEITAGNDYDGADGIDLAVEVGIEAQAQYDFKINYNQPDFPPVQIEDTVPAEWNVVDLVDDSLNCSYESANGKNNGKSATKLVCLPDGTEGMVTVLADARCHDSKNNKKCRPTSCGALYLNNGAAAYELDPDTGEPVLDDEGNRLPPLLETNALCLVAVSDLNGGGIDYSGNGDEDGDGLLDHDEACGLGTDPCNDDTDGDGVIDGLDDCPLEGPADPSLGEILGEDGCIRQSQCSDGIDNDDDGPIDFPNDASCDDILDDSEDTNDQPNVFADLPQLYCNGTCGNWDGNGGCGQGDADVFCRLKTDNAASVATSFTIETALAAPGVCCPPPTWAPGTGGCTDLGVFPVSGFALNISVHPTDVLSTHGPGVAVTNVVCTDP